jgi:hypothetical protein
MQLFELLPYYSWIIDRFHISTQVFQERQTGAVVDFSWLEERLRRQGFRLIFCHRTPESFEAARERRLRVSGNPGQYDDLSVFVEEQSRMRELAGRSRLTRLDVDISDDDIGEAADRIADWLEATGGLEAPEGLEMLV